MLGRSFRSVSYTHLDVYKRQRIAAAIVERGVTRLASGRKVGVSLVLDDFADSEAVSLPGFAVPAGFVF